MPGYDLNVTIDAIARQMSVVDGATKCIAARTPTDGVAATAGAQQ
jgi:hypothetical protein